MINMMNMEELFELMESQPSDKHIATFKQAVDKICDLQNTPEIRNECKRLFAKKLDKGQSIKWMDLILGAFLVNEGLVFRDVVVQEDEIPPQAGSPSEPPSSAAQTGEVLDQDFDEIQQMMAQL